MEAGISFEGLFHAQTSYSMEFQYQFTQNVDHITSMTQTTENVVKCGDKYDNTEIYGLYQWTITSGDNLYTAMDEHYVCRKNENAYTAPNCPYEACRDAECTICDPAWKA